MAKNKEKDKKTKRRGRGIEDEPYIGQLSEVTNQPLPGVPIPSPQMQAPGLVRPQGVSIPMPAPQSSIRFSLNGPAELREFDSSIPMSPPVMGQAFGQEYQPIEGSYSPAPVIQQTQQQQDEAAQASRQYDLNARGPEYVQQQDAQRAEQERDIAQDQAYTAAYKEGRIPELDAKSSTGGSYRMLKDDQGRVVGAWNPKTRQMVEAPAEGLRTGAVSEDQRQGVVGRAGTVAKLARLGELAKAHADSIGPVAAKITAMQQSGWAPEAIFGSLDPEVAEMYTLSQDLQNARLYEASGKQINEAEARRLRADMPRLDQNLTQFWVAYQKMVSDLNRKRYLLKEDGQIPAANPTLQPDQPTTPTGEKRRIRL